MRGQQFYKKLASCIFYLSTSYLGQKVNYCSLLSWDFRKNVCPHPKAPLVHVSRHPPLHRQSTQTLGLRMGKSFLTPGLSLFMSWAGLAAHTLRGWGTSRALGCSQRVLCVTLENAQPLPRGTELWRCQPHPQSSVCGQLPPCAGCTKRVCKRLGSAPTPTQAGAKWNQSRNLRRGWERPKNG